MPYFTSFLIKRNLIMYHVLYVMRYPQLWLLVMASLKYRAVTNDYFDELLI